MALSPIAAAACDLDAMARIVTCVYCGQAYPEGTPASQHQLLFDHIKGCDKHPMHGLIEVLKVYADPNNWHQGPGAKCLFDHLGYRDGWLLAEVALEMLNEPRRVQGEDSGEDSGGRETEGPGEANRPVAVPGS